MIPFSLLEKMKVYVDENFLSPDICAQIQAELRHGSHSPVAMTKMGVIYDDDQSRKTLSVAPSKQTLGILNEQLSLLQPKLCRFFDLPLDKFELPYFFRYQKGHYFMPHRDAQLDPHPDDQLSRKRKLSAICFLNTQSEESPAKANEFSGGDLVVYDLLSAKTSKNIGIPITAKLGLLMVFDATLLHEVTPVTSGERFTVVTFFTHEKKTSE